MTTTTGTIDDTSTTTATTTGATATAATEHEGDIGYAIVELMGHRTLVGYVSSVDLFGAAMLRLDIPATEGHAACTQYYSGSAIYCITPTTEEIVRDQAPHLRPAPAHRWQYAEPRQPRITAPRFDGDAGIYTDEEANMDEIPF